jgi:hypothetical protein
MGRICAIACSVSHSDAQHHDVGHADLAGVVGRLHARHVDRLRSLDPQAVAPHRLQVLATCDEMHIGATLREACAEIAAEPARAHDRDPHVVSFFLLCSMVMLPLRTNVYLCFTANRQRWCKLDS